MSVEQVMVVPSELFRSLGYFQGFSRETERYLPTLLRPEHISYQPRDQMERDPSFKQLIPYVVFRHRDAGGRVSLFRYLRGKGQGESRLHAKVSIGVGGHICSMDGADATLAYDEGMRRELREEVDIGTPYSVRCLGLINDDLTDVGRVHLGIVHLVDVEEPRVAPREPDLLEAGFRPASELAAEREAMESWSQICL